MKVVVLSSHTPSLMWFRTDMMKEMIRQGCEVTAIGQSDDKMWFEKFSEMGITYRSVFVKRNGTNPFSDIHTFFSILSALREIKPDKIFVYQAKTIIYGSIAAKMLGITDIYALVAGIGSVFINKGFKNSIVKTILKIQYKTSLACCKNIFYQNNDDKKTFLDNRLLKKEKMVRINGSGVNTELFSPVPFPENISFLYVGRLVKDKGIVEYLEACRIVKHKHKDVKCLLVGPFDTNPSALTENELQKYIDDGTVEFFGEQQDVRPFLSQCSVFVLPSYREGTPRSVLEAMALGRPIITSDAPGCRETVDDKYNGFLTEVRNSSDVAEKMMYFIENPGQVSEMGKRSREICVDKFDVVKVNNCILKTMGIKSHNRRESFESV